MSQPPNPFVTRIVDGALDLTSTAALFNDRSIDLTDPKARAVAEYIATGTIAYLNHLAARFDAAEEIAAFYMKVANGFINEENAA